MSAKNAAVVFVIVLMSSTLGQAMVVPGRWEKVASEKAGSRLIVTLKTGDYMECAFVRLSDDSLIVSTPNGVEREYSKANVARITTADKRMGSLVNGTIIGAAVVGIPMAIFASSVSGSGTEKANAVLLMTGIGAAIGLAIDAGVKGYITLYEAPKNEPGS